MDYLCDETQKGNLNLYTRQSQEEGFQLIVTRIMNNNTLQAALLEWKAVVISKL